MEESSKTEGSSSSKKSDLTWPFRSPTVLAARAARGVLRHRNSSAVRHRPYVRKHSSKPRTGALLRDLDEDDEVDSTKLQMERKPQRADGDAVQQARATKDDEQAVGDDEQTSFKKVDGQKVGDAVKQTPATKEPRRLPWPK